MKNLASGAVVKYLSSVVVRTGARTTSRWNLSTQHRTRDYAHRTDTKVDHWVLPSRVQNERRLQCLVRSFVSHMRPIVLDLAWSRPSSLETSVIAALGVS